MTRDQVATYGPYQVIHDPLVHRPWGLYRIYKGERYIGAQISYPDRSQCEALEHAKRAEEVKTSFVTHREKQAIRRGRPTNAERDRRRMELERDLGITIPTL